MKKFLIRKAIIAVAILAVLILGGAIYATNARFTVNCGGDVTITPFITVNGVHYLHVRAPNSGRTQAWVKEGVLWYGDVVATAGKCKKTSTMALSTASAYDYRCRVDMCTSGQGETMLTDDISVSMNSCVYSQDN